MRTSPTVQTRMLQAQGAPKGVTIRKKMRIQRRRGHCLSTMDERGGRWEGEVARSLLGRESSGPMRMTVGREVEGLVRGEEEEEVGSQAELIGQSGSLLHASFGLD